MGGELNEEEGGGDKWGRGWAREEGGGKEWGKRAG